MDKKLIASLALTLFCTPVLASDMLSAEANTGIGNAATVNSFTSLDTDQDGFVTQQEVAKVVNPTGDFSQSDRNQDGKLDLAEFETYLDATHGSGSAMHGMSASGSPMTSAPTFEQLDVNGDGMLTLGEYDAAPRIQGSAAIEETNVLIVPVPAGTDAIIMAPPADLPVPVTP